VSDRNPAPPKRPPATPPEPQARPAASARADRAFPAPRPAPDEAADDPLEYAEGEETTESIWSVLGSVARRGVWQPPARLRVLASLGSVDLDYRDAELAYDVNDLTVIALLGSVRIRVPNDVEVEVDSSALLGSVAHEAKQSLVPRLLRGLIGTQRRPDADPDLEIETPLLRIKAFALLGSVVVRVQ
jgi:hypothetical protein